MKNLLFACAAIFIFLSWLLPIHYRPWATYTGELYAFFALFALAAVFIKQPLQLPKIALPMAALAFLPLIQFAFGQVYYFSIAILGFAYVFGFWLAICMGFSLSARPQQKEQTFAYLSYTFLAGGVCTGLIAICQWLNFDAALSSIMMNISGSTRPFANFAQPNNMATFLLMALLACLYLYEQGKVKTRYLTAAAIPILIGIALSQSRTSWVASLCILLYLAYAQYRDYIRLRWFYSLAWFIGFLALIVLMPKLSQFISQMSDMNIQESRDVVQRAGGDMSRLAIWKQMAHAAAAQPWLGYGWYQTSTAFVAISEQIQGPVWVRSAHNFILDFVLWNGLLIAVPFFGYAAFWLIQLHRGARTASSVIGLLMIGVFLIHAMLEFPQNYAYFLLPAGFILGTVQAQNASAAVLHAPALFMRAVFGAGIILLILIYRDYDVLVPKLNQSARYEQAPEKITRNEKIYVLTEFNHRINFIRQNPYAPMTIAQLEDAEKLVRSYPTKYHLLEYAKMLAYNGHEAEARHQLQRLQAIQKRTVSYSELIQDMPKK